MNNEKNLVICPYNVFEGTYYGGSKEIGTIHKSNRPIHLLPRNLLFIDVFIYENISPFRLYSKSRVLYRKELYLNTLKLQYEN